MSLLGIDLGGTKLALASFTPGGDIVARRTVPVSGCTGAEVGALIVAEARALAASDGASRIDAVGAAVPGIYHADRGTVWAPNIPGWDDYPLRDELQEAFGADVAVNVESDRAAYIAGETWRGAAAGSRNAIFLAVGTGIGAGLLVDGRILHGHGDIAGAIGWLALDRPYRMEYVDCGHFEHHASGPGLAKCARAMLAADAGYTGLLRDADITTASVLEAYDARDPIAVRVVEDAIAFWGMAAANLVSLFNPEQVIFGGGVFGPATRFIPRIRDEAARWAQPISMTQVRFVASTLSSDAGLYGAARLAMQRGASAQPTPEVTA